MKPQNYINVHTYNQQQIYKHKYTQNILREYKQIYKLLNAVFFPVQILARIHTLTHKFKKKQLAT